ncbi:MAG TPA: DUF2934 domain-containing protein [Verrucomicrobiae bacterium]|nr:DUF2934 domain-containing protein [Verrucomicrobiae bacterium]
MRIHGPREDEVRARAYEIYLERGGQPGRDLDDWLQAEFELIHLPFHVPELEPIKARSGFVRQQRGRSSRALP